MTQVFDGAGQGDVTSNGIYDLPPFDLPLTLDVRTAVIEQAPGVGTILPLRGIQPRGVYRTARV